MALLIARTQMGGRDLYYGVPDLTAAIITKQSSVKTPDDYQTTLTLETPDGETHEIIIVQERVD